MPVSAVQITNISSPKTIISSNMAHSISEVGLIWAVVTMAFYHAATIEASTQFEALISTGWWSSDTSDHCKWHGIICNGSGNVTEINLHNCSRGLGELSKLEFPSFQSLVRLELSSCGLNGSIPPQIGKLTELTHLDLSGNFLTGELPVSLANLTQLVELHLSQNHIYGSIPSKIGSMKNLIDLNLGDNHLVGAIPPSLSQLTKLTFLYLNGNQINGSIPLEIGNLENLIYLLLNDNNLTGLSHGIGGLINLIYLSLSRNKISQPIPEELGNCSSLQHLDLSNNYFTGDIPIQIGDLALHRIDLSNNLLVGRIPSGFQNLRSLDYMNLSHNKLSGTIPSLTYSYNWTLIDLSYNDLEGHIPFELQNASQPGAFDHNKGLCGEIRGWPHCKKGHRIKMIIVISLSTILFLSFAVFGCLFLSAQKKRRDKKILPTEAAAPRHGDLFSIWGFDGRLVYEDIIKATKDFDIKYCIGAGGSSRVYKAQLPDGNVVALKKLHHLEIEEPAYIKSFKTEVQILSAIRHRDIVKLHGFCQHKKAMFLIYDYKERGNLCDMLRNEVGAVELDWIKRVNVVKSIAHALSYMHHDCNTPIIHRDISSNNILLDSELKAFVSDFGTAKLIYPNSSNQTLLAGTYGYIAPGEWLCLLQCYGLM